MIASVLELLESADLHTRFFCWTIPCSDEAFHFFPAILWMRQQDSDTGDHPPARMGSTAFLVNWSHRFSWPW